MYKKKNLNSCRLYFSVFWPPWFANKKKRLLHEMGICAIAIMLLITFFCAYFQHVQNDSPSSKSLAGLVVQLLHFQEDAFGRRVNNPALTKLPVSIQTLHSPKIAITVESQMVKCSVLMVPLISSGQVFPGFQGRRCSLSHFGICLQV